MTFLQIFTEALSTLTVYRTTAGSYDANGRYQEGSETSFSIQASEQPIKGSDLQLLDEGARQQDIRVVYTETKLQATDPKLGTLADEVVIEGSRYKVLVAKHHTNLFTKAIVAREREA